jgi:ketosteroid isomerase-like protein
VPRQDHETVLRAFYSAWSRTDVEAALRHCADDVVYTVYLPFDILPFEGEAQSRWELSQIMRGILRNFVIVRFVPLGVTVFGHLAHAQVQFCFRHRASGLELDGVMRHEVMFHSGRNPGLHATRHPCRPDLLTDGRPL